MRVRAFGRRLSTGHDGYRPASRRARAAAIVRTTAAAAIIVIIICRARWRCTCGGGGVGSDTDRPPPPSSRACDDPYGDGARFSAGPRSRAFFGPIAVWLGGGGGARAAPAPKDPAPHHPTDPHNDRRTCGGGDVIFLLVK